MEYTKEELDCMNEYRKMLLNEILIKAELMSDNYEKMSKKCDSILKNVKKD